MKDILVMLSKEQDKQQKITDELYSIYKEANEKDADYNKKASDYYYNNGMNNELIIIRNKIQDILIKQLKEKMLIEINNYIIITKDYDLDNFASKYFIEFEKEYDLELMWYDTKRNKDNFVTEIEIESL